jgi:hypothetical protein
LSTLQGIRSKLVGYERVAKVILDLFGQMFIVAAEVYALLLMAWFVILMFTGLYFDGAFDHVNQRN